MVNVPVQKPIQNCHQLCAKYWKLQWAWNEHGQWRILLQACIVLPSRSQCMPLHCGMALQIDHCWEPPCWQCPPQVLEKTAPWWQIFDRYSQLCESRPNAEEICAELSSELWRMRVLLMMQDVSESSHLQELMTASNNPKSRISLTIRNWNVVREVDGIQVLSINQRSGHDSMELFCRWAFDSGNIPAGKQKYVTSIAILVLAEISHMFLPQGRPTRGSTRALPLHRQHQTIREDSSVQWNADQRSSSADLSLMRWGCWTLSHTGY